MSRWQDAYQEYVELRLLPLSPPQRCLLDAAVYYFGGGVDRMEPWATDLLNTADWGPYQQSWRTKIADLRTVAHQAGVGYGSDPIGSPLEDVYEAAFYMNRHQAFNDYIAQQIAAGFREAAEAPLTSVYRGQRDHRWRTIPTLYREPHTAEETAQRIGNLRAFDRALAASPLGKGLNREQRLAVAKHHGIPSQFIDVTTVAYVALHFAASDKPEHSGQIGVVSRFNVVEWRRLFRPGSGARVGSMRSIEVPGVLRIANQRGQFLVGAHPDTIPQYMPEVIAFRQTALAFEDPSRGVTAARIYPPAAEDPHLRFFKRWEARMARRGRDPGWGQLYEKEIQADLALARQPLLPADDYMAIALDWITGGQPATPELTRQGKELLMWLCRFYALVRKKAYEEKDPYADIEYSIHFLEQTVDLVLAYPHWTLKRLLANVVERPGSHYRDRVLADLRQEADWPKSWR